MKRPALIATIAVSVFVLLGLVAFAVYWTEFRGHDNAASASLDVPRDDPAAEADRKKAIGTVLGTVVSQPPGSLLGGVEVEVSYEGTHWAQDEPKTYGYTLGGGDGPHVTIARQGGGGSSALWTVPYGLFTDSLRFTITAKGTTITSEEPVRVTPVWRASGPGGNILVKGSPVRFVLEVAGSLVGDTAPTLFFSVDGGATWTVTDAGPLNPVTSAFVYRPQQSPGTVQFSIRSTTAPGGPRFPRPLVSNIPTLYNIRSGPPAEPIWATASDGGVVSKVVPGETLYLHGYSGGGGIPPAILLDPTGGKMTGAEKALADHYGGGRRGLLKVTLPDAQTMEGVESVVIKVDGDGTAVLTVVSNAWSYTGDGFGVPDGARMFGVSVRALYPEDAFADPDNWNFTVKAADGTLYGMEALKGDMGGTVEVGRGYQDNVYLVTMRLDKEFHGVSATPTKVRVSVGYRPLNEDGVVRNPGTQLLRSLTCLPWEPKAAVTYCLHVNKDEGVMNFSSISPPSQTPSHSGQKQFTTLPMGARVALRVGDESVTRDNLVWRLVYSNTKYGRVALGVSQQGRASILTTVPHYAYGLAHVEVETNCLDVLRSPDFLIAPNVSLGGRGAGPGPQTDAVTVVPGTEPLLLTLSGFSSWIGRTAGVLRTLQYRDGGADDDGDWRTLGAGTTYPSSSSVSVSLGNQFFEEKVRLRMCVEATGLPPVYSQATPHLYETTSVPVNHDFQTFVYGDKTTNVRLGEPVRLGQGTESAAAAIAKRTGPEDDAGNINYRVYVQDDPVNSTGAVQVRAVWDESKREAFVDLTGVTSIQSNGRYVLVLRLRSDLDTLYETNTFTLVAGFGAHVVDLAASPHKTDYFTVAVRVELPSYISPAEIEIKSNQYQQSVSPYEAVPPGPPYAHLYLVRFKSGDDDATSPHPYLVPWNNMTSPRDVRLTVTYTGDLSDVTPDSIDLPPTAPLKTFQHLPVPTPSATLTGTASARTAHHVHLNPQRFFVHPVYGITVTRMSKAGHPIMTFAGHFGTSYRAKVQNWTSEDPFGRYKYTSEDVGVLGEEWLDMYGTPDGPDDRPVVTIYTGNVGPHTNKLERHDMVLTDLQKVQSTYGLYDRFWNGENFFNTLPPHFFSGARMMTSSRSGISTIRFLDKDGNFKMFGNFPPKHFGLDKVKTSKHVDEYKLINRTGLMSYHTMGTVCTLVPATKDTIAD